MRARENGVATAETSPDDAPAPTPPAARAEGIPTVASQDPADGRRRRSVGRRAPRPVPPEPTPVPIAAAGGGAPPVDPPGPGDDGPGPGEGETPGPPERPAIRLRWLRLVGLLVPIGALAIVSTLFGMMMAVASDLPDLDTSKEFQTAKNTVLLDRNGSPLGVLTGSDTRYVVPSDEISASMKQAVIAMEDERFETNSGVDIRGIARAAFQDIVERRAAQGASTIPQQLVKLSLEAQSNRTVFEKLREAALAYHMKRKWSKAKILGTYLNRVYFGNGAYGVEAAAKTYFGRTPQHAGCGPPKDPCASQLRPAESALLTAIIASPSKYDPNEHPTAALDRRNVVLQKMRDQNRIDQTTYLQAKAEAIPSRDEIEPPSLDVKNPYFASWVGNLLVAKYGAQRTYEGGLKVRTTLDQGLQNAAQQAVNSYLTRPTGPQASMVVIDNQTGEVRAMVGGRDFRRRPFNLATQGARQPGSAFKPFVLAQALRQGIQPSSVWASKRLVLHPKDEAGNRETFRVTNDESAYAGKSTLARALTYSDNAVFAKVGLTVGTKRISKLITKAGIRTPVSTNAALTLGAPRHGVTVLDMAHAYETFATRGLRVQGSLGAPDGGPVGFTEVDQGGKTLAKNDRVRKRVVSQPIADETTKLMRTVVSQGTGKRAAYGGFAAGKTGTTSGNVDAWFVGFSKNLTVAVWVGYPTSGKPMSTEFEGEPVEGGTYPAAIWGAFMGKAEAILRNRDPKYANPKGDDVPVGGALPRVKDTVPGDENAGGGPSSDTSTSSGDTSTSAAPATDSSSSGDTGTTGGSTAGSGTGSSTSDGTSSPATPATGSGSSSGTGSSGAGTSSGSGSGSGTSGSGTAGGTGDGGGGAVPAG